MENDNNAAKKGGNGRGQKPQPVGKGKPKGQIACRYFTSKDGCLKGVKCDMLHVDADPKIAAPRPAELEVAGPVNVPKPSVEVLPDFASFLGRRSLGVPEAEREVIEYARTQGWRVVALPGRPTIPHALSHTAREVATLEAARHALTGIVDGRVLDVYGSDRTSRLLRARGYDIDGKPIMTRGSLQVESGPAELYPGDAGKNRLARVRPSGLYNFVLATDVYWDGPRGRVDTKAVKGWAEWSVNSCVYIISRAFFGSAGADNVAGYNKAEGAWFKDDAGLVNFSSDEGSYGLYPPHHSLEFLRHKSVDGLSVEFMGAFGPYDLHRCTVEGADIQGVQMQFNTAPSGKIVKMEISLYSRFNVFSRMSSYLWATLGLRIARPHSLDVLVHVTTLHELQALYSAKQPTGHIYDNVVGQVRERLLRDVLVQRVAARFPIVFGRILSGTAQAVLYSDRAQTALFLGGLRRGHHESEVELLEARGVNPIGFAPWNFGWILPYIFVAVFAILVARIPGAVGTQLPCGAECCSLVEYFDTPPVIGVSGAMASTIGVVVIAMAFYYILRGAGPKPQWAAWLRAHTAQEPYTIAASGVEALPELTLVPAVQCKVIPESVARGTLRVEVDRVEMSVAQAQQCLSDEAPRGHSYAIAITSGMLYQPAKTDWNLLAACIHRLHAARGDVPDTGVLREIWDESALLFRVLHIGNPGVQQWEPVSIEECARALGGVKGQTFLETFRQMNRGNCLGERKGVMVKWNETLGTKNLAGFVTIRPRSIVVLSNDYHVVFAPLARGVANVLHTIFDGSVSFDGIRIFYAAGYTGTQLNAVGTALWADDGVIAVSGDDSVIKFPAQVAADLGIAVLGEGDFSAFDQSQCIECLSAHMLWLMALGVPASVCELILYACSQPYKARGRRLRIDGDPGAQLATGIDWTTILNSLSCLLYWLRVLRVARVRQRPEVCARQMGFSLKYKEVHDVCQLTFLKGWWQLGLAGMVWCPLPSQVLKLGKMLREPRLFSVTKKDSLQGIRVVARALGLSFPGLNPDYPILGPFVEMLYRCGISSKKMDVYMSSSEDGWYKPATTGGIYRDEAVLSMCARYEITHVDILRVESLCRSVTSLPVFVYDPVFERLALVDYT